MNIVRDTDINIKTEIQIIFLKGVGKIMTCSVRRSLVHVYPETT